MGIDTINFSGGYSSKYYISFVDVQSWTDMGRVEITGGSINREETDLMQSADIDCVNYSETSERLIRVWLDISQYGENGHIPLFTGWASSPGRNINGTYVTNTLQCYSILKPAQDILLPPGWYAPVSTSSEQLIRNLLRPTNAPVDFDSPPPNLQNALIAEENENNLSMAELIADTVGYRIKIEGDGHIYLNKIPDKVDDIIPADRFDSRQKDILEPSLTESYDWYNCPNVLRAVADNVSSIARDDNPNSIFSTVSRGREIWAQETNCDLNEDESINEYAARRLKELQKVYRTISYDRRFIPDVYPGDYIELFYPAQSINGLFLVSSQTITLGYNARTSEEVVQIK